MPSSTSSVAVSSPRSTFSPATSPELTPRSPIETFAPLGRAAASTRGFDAQASALLPHGRPRPASAEARLPVPPAPRGNRVVRQLDFSNIPVSNTGRGVAGTHRHNLTLDLSLLNESPDASLSFSERLRDPVWTTSPDFPRRNFSTGTSPAVTYRNPSTGTSPAATFRSAEFDPTQLWVHAQHDEARRLIDTRGQDAVHALLCVVTELLTRTEAPTPPSAGKHTPLWKDKVDNLDPVFLDKLPALALARRLQTIYQRATSGLALFDQADGTQSDQHSVQAARFGQIQALTSELLESMMSETTPTLLALLGGEKRARLGYVKIIADHIERGIETRDFPQDEPRYAAIGKLLLEASYDLSDLAKDAMGGSQTEDAGRKNRTALTQRVIAALP